MIGIVVVTHGQLARELVAAAEMIIGEIPNVTAVSIGWHESPDDAQREIEEADDLLELATEAAREGKDNIYLAGNLLARKENAKDDAGG